MYVSNLFKYWIHKIFDPNLLTKEKYEAFRNLLEYDKKSHELIAEIEQIYYDQRKVDFTVIEYKLKQLSSSVAQVVESLSEICPTCYPRLDDYFRRIDTKIKQILPSDLPSYSPPFVLKFDQLDSDSHQLVGGKAATLGTNRKNLGLPVPSGFVITANSYNYFLETNNLRERIDGELARLDINSARSLEKTSKVLVEGILSGQIPTAIEEEITAALEEIRKDQKGRLGLSVRSSAVGEDSVASFAGQYESVLNVEPDKVVDSYKAVIASKYSPRALNYRINYGLSDRETPMAVMVLEMIDAGASGVVYTVDPEEPEDDTLLIHCTWGLGKLLVDGSVTPSVIKVKKEPPYELERDKETSQPVKAICASTGGRGMVSGVDDLPANLALNDDSARNLVTWAIKLEDFYGVPQDIEWCLDNQGKLFILQSRPLHIEETELEMVDCSKVEVDNRVLLSGGNKACGGIASGKVYKLEKSSDLETIPGGAIVVTKVPSPDLVEVVGKTAAVITDVGSPAGHFASVAREFGIPALVNTGHATRVLTSGDRVTLYADAKVVYEGVVQQLLESACAARSLIVDSPFMKTMQDVLAYVSPLNLVDPMAESFVPEGCKTLHDILRFAHEKSVYEMFSHGARRRGGRKGVKKLISEIPITVHLLDVGEGLRPESGAKRAVAIEEVVSAPFRALWEGLGHPDLYWDPEVKHFDWEEFDRISAGIVPLDSLGSYAILSSDYLNLNIHFGYHFVVLDTLCGDEYDNNYIMLRFAGGGGGFHSRSLRVKFLGEILSHIGFKTKMKRDLIEAQFMRDDRSAIEAKLEKVGILLGCTRLLDLVFKDEQDVEIAVNRFLSGDYNLSPIGKR
ncbi:MAG: PEP/pyruvate-binding domain-containing protein [Syntrophobacterales bacterium]|jgi:pyruvate,water dikinase